MAIEIISEEESGTYTGHLHPHNGYYAGDFSMGSVVSIASRMPTAGHSEVVPGGMLLVASAA
jgi:hypothetical protein